MDDFLNDPVFKKLQTVVWPDSLEETKELAEEIVGVWDWTKKAPDTITAIRTATNTERVQKIVYNTYLSGARMKVNA